MSLLQSFKGINIYKNLRFFNINLRKSGDIGLKFLHTDFSESSVN